MINRFLLLGLVFAMTINCFADKNDGFPNVSGEEKDLAKLVGEACVWNHYWYNNWGKDFHDAVRVGREVTIGVCFNKDQNGYDVFFDRLPVDFYFGKDGSWSAANVIEDYHFAGSSNEREMKDYFDFKATKISTIENFNINFDRNIFEVVKFGSFNRNKQDFIKKVFLEKILRGDDLTFIQDNLNNNAKAPIVIKVGNFSFKYPYFYYYVKGLNDEGGAPYLGFVYFDLQTHQVLSEQLDSGEIQPTKRKYKHAIDRIDQNGMTFKYVDGHLIEN